jgi:pyruvyltransferase
MKTKPIRLYWWNGAPNFGDGINPRVVEWISGRKVKHSSQDDAELVAIGSLMQIMEGSIRRRAGPLKTFWGTGMMAPSEIIGQFNKSPHVRMTLVRGPISELLSGHEGLPHGDPGLLVDRVYGRVDKKFEIGVVPHKAQWTKKFTGMLNENPRLKLIDVRNDDAEQVVKEIASCEYILSGSLHGLVIADAYGIPNFWMNGPEWKQSDMKFFDYKLSVKRHLSQPRPIDKCIGKIDRGELGEFAYFKKIESIKNTIEAAFPDEFRA